jgi:hypothetical protein
VTFDAEIDGKEAVFVSVAACVVVNNSMVNESHASLQDLDLKVPSKVAKGAIRGDLTTIQRFAPAASQVNTTPPNHFLADYQNGAKACTPAHSKL